MAGLDGIVPQLANAFLRLQADAAAQGFSIGISSGLRDINQQAALRKKNGCKDIWGPSPARECVTPTAIPGTSKHERGLAIDVAANKAAKAWLAQNAARYGLVLPVEGEDWHLELAGGAENAGFAQGAFQMGGLNPELNWLETPGASPEERQDALLSGYMDAIAGANRDEILASPAEAPELATPGAPEVASPGLAQDFTSEGMGQELRQDVTTVPGPAGAPQGAGAGGGAWTGNAPPPGYVPPGKGVERWRDVAIAALRYTGQDPALVDILLKRMAQESGGNPTAVNNWDSNAKRGDPSKGLMQNIGSAFPERARELANRGIFDGFANIVASIRYTLNRYGDLSKGWGRPGGY